MYSEWQPLSLIHESIYCATNRIAPKQGGLGRLCGILKKIKSEIPGQTFLPSFYGDIVKQYPFSGLRIIPSGYLFFPGTFFLDQILENDIKKTKPQVHCI